MLTISSRAISVFKNAKCHNYKVLGIKRFSFNSTKKQSPLRTLGWSFGSVTVLGGIGVIVFCGYSKYFRSLVEVYCPYSKPILQALFGSSTMLGDFDSKSSILNIGSINSPTSSFINKDLNQQVNESLPEKFSNSEFLQIIETPDLTELDKSIVPSTESSLSSNCILERKDCISCSSNQELDTCDSEHVNTPILVLEGECDLFKESSDECHLDVKLTEERLKELSNKCSVFLNLVVESQNDLWNLSNDYLDVVLYRFSEICKDLTNADLNWSQVDECYQRFQESSNKFANIFVDARDNLFDLIKFVNRAKSNPRMCYNQVLKDTENYIKTYVTELEQCFEKPLDDSKLDLKNRSVNDSNTDYSEQFQYYSKLDQMPVYLKQVEHEFIEHLRRQILANELHTEILLDQERERLKIEYYKETEQLMRIERSNMREKFNGIFSHLHEIKEGLNSNYHNAKMLLKSQKLWHSCVAFYNFAYEIHTKSDVTCSIINDVFLSGHIESIRAASESDVFVDTVLSSIKPIKCGYAGFHVSETALRERFQVVERACRRLALVNDGRAGLFLHMISYLRSFLLFNRKLSFSLNEITSTPIKPNIQTEEIVSTARYLVDTGNLEMAVRYLSLLKGKARDVAYDWCEDCRRLLEIRQAASVLMWHIQAHTQSL